MEMPGEKLGLNVIIACLYFINEWQLTSMANKNGNCL